ncbi:MAG: carboxyl transferase domain-containing protein [Thermomicrobiales bacterium]
MTNAEPLLERLAAEESEGEGLDAFGDFDLDLACPSCGTDLTGADLFAVFRVCPSCHRHFSVPARERLGLLVDEDCFLETNAALISVDPIVFHDQLPFPDRIAEAHERGFVSDAVITGTGEIGGHSAVLVLIDHVYLGGSIGAVAGEKIALAMELAVARRLPLIAICSGGAPRTQEGMLTLVQLAKSAAMASRLHRAGVPFVSVLTHPTTGGVYAGLANQADIVVAEPGARIGFGSARGSAGVPVEGGGPNTAEFLREHGMIDDLVDRTRLRGYLGRLLDLFAVRGLARPSTPLASWTGGSARGWEAVALARHAERPTSLDYIRRLMPEFVELHGDRAFGDDPAVICGLGRLEGVSVAVIAQERGRGEEQERRRGGRLSPEGYRKASRLMRLAGHLELPLVTLVDTPGAMSGIEAEARGIGVAVSQAFGLMSMLPVPIVSVVVGEASGAGALALGVGDRILMQEHAIFSVTGPESAAVHPYQAGDRGSTASTTSKLTARDCHRLGVVDVIVPEPSPGAHADPDFAATQVKLAILQALDELAGVGPRRLLDDRARKVRYLGQTTPAGREAARLELRELQELQRSLSRSFDELRRDLRDRWEHRNVGRNLPNLPNLPNLANLPTLPDLSARLHRHRPDLTDLAGRLGALRESAVGSRQPAGLDVEASGDTDDAGGGNHR